MTKSPPTISSPDIIDTIELFTAPGQVVELRALNVRRQYGRPTTANGYFDGPAKLAQAALGLNGTPSGMYFTANPIDPNLLARRCNRIEMAGSGECSADKDVLERRWLLIDLDPVRPSGISSTDDEHQASIQRARDIRDFLTTQSWPEPVLASSGNGAHLVYPIDLPCDDDGTCERILAALATQFDDDTVKVDGQTHNPGRLLKLYGSFSRKGDDTADRPHRIASIVDRPDKVVPVPEVALRTIAELAPAPPSAPSRQAKGNGNSSFDIQQWITDHNLDVAGPTDWQGGRKWVFPICPWNTDHKNRSAFIVQASGGGIEAGCHHNGCHGLGWHDLRDSIEPDWRNKPSSKSTSAKKKTLAKIEPFRPFPVDVLPRAIARFVHETSDAVGCNAALVGLPVLSVLAATIGTTRSIELKSSWYEYAIVWTCTIGRSGGLKSPAMDAAVEPLHRAQLLKLRDHQIAVEEYETKLLHHERDHAAWKRSKIDEDPPKKPSAPSAVRYVVADTTIEALVPIIEANQRGILVARDELRGWFGGFNQYKSERGGDVAAWLELWRGGTLIVDRKGHQKTTHIPRAAASICGGIQPGVLTSIASAEYLDSGLIPRVLWAYPPEKVKRWTSRVPGRATLTAYEGVIRDLLNLRHVETEYGSEPICLPLTDAARERWVPWYNRHARRIADATTEHLAAALSKCEAYGARFSLIFALVADPNTSEVSSEAVERGTQLADWFAHELERVYRVFDESDEERGRRKLTELIQRKGGSVTPRELTRSSSQFAKATDAEAALDKLVTAGIARWEHAPSTPKGGKPSKRLVLIDAIANDNTPPGAPVSKGIVSVNGVSAQGNTLGRATRDTPSRANSSGVTTVDNSLSGRVSTDPLPFDSPHAPIEGSETILNTFDTTDTDNTPTGAHVSGGIVNAGEENGQSDANAEEETTWTA